MCKCVPWLLSGPLTHVESEGGASEDAVATTPAPNPDNQTTSAQAEVTGRLFLFSFCVVFCKFGFCIKCVSVSRGFSLAPSLTWNPRMERVKMLWTAKVMMWLSPQHPIPTTRPHLSILKLVVRFSNFCSHSGGGVEFCHDYGLVFFISVHVHLLLASGEKKEPFSLSLEIGRAHVCTTGT